MEMPREGTGWETLVEEFGLFHLTRMQADPKTEGIAGAFADRQKALEDKAAAFKAAERAKTAIEAELIKADLDLDEAVRDLYFRKLGACGNNKADAGLKRFFPDGLTEVVRMSFPEEMGKVQTLILVMKETPQDPLAAEFIPRLEALLGPYQKAIDALAACVKASDAAWALIEAEKVSWLAAYKKDYAGILAIFSGSQRPTDTFFKKAAKRSPKKPDEPAKEEKG